MTPVSPGQPVAPVVEPVVDPSAGESGIAGTARRRMLRLVGSRRPEPPAPPVAPPLATPPERRRVTTATVVAGGLLLVTGLVLAFAGYLLVGSGLAANRNQGVMYDHLRTSLAQATVPVSAPIAAGTPLGVVSVPTIGLEQVFVEGSSSEQTLNGPGLTTGSVLPGQTGLSVLVGRRATFGAPFAHLDRLHPGDRIDVTTGQGRFAYVVDLVRTSDAPASQVRVVPSRLTLVTSDPAFTPDRKLVVSAHLTGNALPASTGTTAPASDQPGHGSHDRAVELLLWCQLLLLVTVAVTWAALRLPGRGLWIGAVPVLLAILWNVFENLAVLLPNTL
ncbi:sortase [Nocardioides cynanchi]|uniref:sortase n=1 Tax=Nocardioides cynanchi TaxID=2558918 RepID=UPI0012475F47|nr:sortase [Nocardioides cynanchi]